REGLEDVREVLQDIGAALVETGVEDFCRSVLARANWRAGEPIVIDGLRHKEVARALRRIVAPLDLRVVLLQVDEDARRTRLERARKEDAEKLKSVAGHSTEEQVRSELPNIADLKLEGDRPVEDLVRTVVTWVHQGDGVSNHCTG